MVSGMKSKGRRARGPLAMEHHWGRGSGGGKRVANQLRQVAAGEGDTANGGHLNIPFHLQLHTYSSLGMYQLDGTKEKQEPFQG